MQMKDVQVSNFVFILSSIWQCLSCDMLFAPMAYINWGEKKFYLYICDAI